MARKPKGALSKARRELENDHKSMAEFLVNSESDREQISFRLRDGQVVQAVSKCAPGKGGIEAVSEFEPESPDEPESQANGEAFGRWARASRAAVRAPDQRAKLKAAHVRQAARAGRGVRRGDRQRSRKP